MRHSRRVKTKSFALPAPGRRRAAEEIRSILGWYRQSGPSLLAFARKHALCYIREKLHKLPVQYEFHQHIHPKCAGPRCHFGVVMPAGPDHGLKADIAVVADVVVQKYAEHKPLYRIA